MMTLHNDIKPFRALIGDIHSQTGYRQDVLEKDYYVTLVLEELAEKQRAGLPAYFKGGTALYKALGAPKRFSEDIDLSVDTRGCTNSQNNKRLEVATKKYTSLARNREEGRTNRSEVIAIYSYEPAVPYDKDDLLQRFGKLKVEATSFTISEPVTVLTVTPLLYDCAGESGRRLLKEKYGVRPFNVAALTKERIFIDKLFAAEAYERRSENPERAFECAKHIYDLAVLREDPQIRELLLDERQMEFLLQIRLNEERERRDGIPGVLPSEFAFFDRAPGNTAVLVEYENMQSRYVFNPLDRIEYDDAMEALADIRTALTENPAWVRCGLPPEPRRSVHL